MGTGGAALTPRERLLAWEGSASVARGVLSDNCLTKYLIEGEADKKQGE